MRRCLIILDGFMERKLENKSFKELLLNDLDISYSESYKDFSIIGKDIDSLNCIMNILGINSSKINIGERSFYEGLNKGIFINDNQTILRCNIVKIRNGVLEDFTGGDLPNNIGEILKEIEIENGKLYPCFKYKNLLVLDEKVDFKLYPPHFNIGKDINCIMPKDSNIKSIVDKSYDFFKAQDLEGLILWPWGASNSIDLDIKKENTGMIAGIDLVCGIGKALGMKVIQPVNTNGDSDTDLNNKFRAFLEIIKEVDNLVIHINGFDELSHRKDFNGKLKFIDKVREEFILPLLNYMERYKYKISITCDHRTDSFTGNHEKGLVPYLEISNI